MFEQDGLFNLRWFEIEPEFNILSILPHSELICYPILSKSLDSDEGGSQFAGSSDDSDDGNFVLQDCWMIQITLLSVETDHGQSETG